MILAGDIGGTKTHLVLCQNIETRTFLKEEKYLSRNYGSIQEILREFLQGVTEKIDVLSMGVAGPVVQNQCHATNLPWVISGETIRKEFSIPRVFLLNDLEANAYGIEVLRHDEFLSLQGGTPHRGNRALIAVGTGLGESGIFWDGKQHHPFASEGGHSSFAPTDEEDVDLWRYLRGKYGHVSYERVLSGPGLQNLYRFYVEAKGEREKPEVAQRMAKEDPGRVITESALAEMCPACERALDRFVIHYASEAGNLALKMLAIGGIYIGGGIAPKILPALQSGRFISLFSKKGRFAGLLSSLPVSVILNQATALLGAAYYGQNSGKLS